MNFTQLAEPFPAKDIEWRVQAAGSSNSKTWARVIPYVTNRAIMDRLDEVCGPENWKNEKFEIGPQGGVLSGISIRIGEEWITKWDGADNTDIESVKGGISSAMKRSAVQWGVGRYLYNLKADYAIISPNGTHYQSADKKGKYQAFKWDQPALPAWALPKGDNREAAPSVKKQPPATPSPDPKAIDEWYSLFAGCETMDALATTYKTEYKDAAQNERPAIAEAKDIRKKELSK